MVDKHVAKAIVDAVIFLEYSREDVVNPDAAMEAIEQLASELQMASDEIKSDLCRAFSEVSEEYLDKADFVRGLPEMLGLRGG